MEQAHYKFLADSWVLMFLISMTFVVLAIYIQKYLNQTLTELIKLLAIIKESVVPHTYEEEFTKIENFLKEIEPISNVIYLSGGAYFMFLFLVAMGIYFKP